MYRVLFTCDSNDDAVRNTFLRHDISHNFTVYCKPSNTEIAADALKFAEHSVDEDLLQHLVGAMVSLQHPAVAEQYVAGIGTLYITDHGIIVETSA